PYPGVSHADTPAHENATDGPTRRGPPGHHAREGPGPRVAVPRNGPSRRACPRGWRDDPRRQRVARIAAPLRKPARAAADRAATQSGGRRPPAHLPTTA